MSDSITIADIYKLFEETNVQLQRSREEFDRRIAESERLAAERAAESERRAAERVAESERLAAERVADLQLLAAERVADLQLLAAERKAERDAEHDRIETELERFAAENLRRERAMEQLERTAAQTSREVANLTTRWGRFVEELVRPAVIRMFRDRGIDITQTSLRVKSEKVKMEIDILGVNGNCVVAVECKSRLSQDDVDEMCDRLRKFKSGFPQYANYQVYGAVAGIEINDTVDIYAYRKGLYVIRTSGETVEIANDDKFKAVAW
jgi:hypothetical protein